MSYPIELNNIYYRYEKDQSYILESLDLKINKGEVIGIMGPSGSGKSTLLHIICGIIPHIFRGELKGESKIWGKDISKMKISEISTEINIVFQDPDTQLFFPRIQDEIAFGPENLALPPEEIGKRIDRLLKLIDMEDYRFHNPNNLSGGQKQLITIAAILAMDTKILLLDEILSQIDRAGRERIQKVMEKLKQEGKTMVIVDHELENLQLADRILELRNGKLQDFIGW